MNRLFYIDKLKIKKINMCFCSSVYCLFLPIFKGVYIMYPPDTYICTSFCSSCFCLHLLTLGAASPHTVSCISSHWVLYLLTLGAVSPHTGLCISSHWFLHLLTLGPESPHKHGTQSAFLHNTIKLKF